MDKAVKPKVWRGKAWAFWYSGAGFWWRGLFGGVVMPQTVVAREDKRGRRGRWVRVTVTIRPVGRKGGR